FGHRPVKKRKASPGGRGAFSRGRDGVGGALGRGPSFRRRLVRRALCSVVACSVVARVRRGVVQRLPAVRRPPPRPATAAAATGAARSGRPSVISLARPATRPGSAVTWCPACAAPLRTPWAVLCAAFFVVAVAFWTLLPVASLAPLAVAVAAAPPAVLRAVSAPALAVLACPSPGTEGVFMCVSFRRGVWRPEASPRGVPVPAVPLSAGAVAPGRRGLTRAVLPGRRAVPETGHRSPPVSRGLRAGPPANAYPAGDAQTCGRSRGGSAGRGGAGWHTAAGPAFGAAGGTSREGRRLIRRGPRVRVALIAAAVAVLLGAVVAVAVGTSSSPPGRVPPARVLSAYETAAPGNAIDRDCGFSAPLPGRPGRLLWLFCDTVWEGDRPGLW